MAKQLASIRVKNLSFQYNVDKIIFDKISFLISPQEKVAIMGQNGAGKSTLCKIISAYNFDYSGEILIPDKVKIVYTEQTMSDIYLNLSVQEFLLLAKGLNTICHEYFTLLDLLAFNSEINQFNLNNDLVSSNSFNDLLINFTNFILHTKLPELQVSEECAVELMLDIEDVLNSDENQNEELNLKLKQALKFLKQCPDNENIFSLPDFLTRFDQYWLFLKQKSLYQQEAKNKYLPEMMNVLAVLQEKYDLTMTYEINNEITQVLEVVALDKIDINSRIELLSGGQKSRLLMAQAILQNPDILILDEPTNNLDQVSYFRLQNFVKNFTGTLLIISHDTDFLEPVINKVLYLDIFNKSIREYAGNYSAVKTEIQAQIIRDKSKLHRQENELKAKKEIYAKRSQQAKIYNSEGLAKIAKNMRQEIAKMEENKTKIFKEDVAIAKFTIPTEIIDESLMAIDYISKWDNNQAEDRKGKLIPFFYQVEKSQCVLIAGKNGIGKSWFLKECVQYAKCLNLKGTEIFTKNIVNLEALNLDIASFKQQMSKKIWFSDLIKIGYYSQDFATLDFNLTVQASMEQIHPFRYQDMRFILAKFLFYENHLSQKIGDLSEGQKALLSWARLVFLEPNLLILDEPTNHINFKHLPIIKMALQKYHGTIILVCHDQNFVKGLPLAQVFDLNKEEMIKGKKFVKNLFFIKT